MVADEQGNLELFDLPVWKKDLAAVLARLPDMGQKFTGEVFLHMNQGGVTEIRVTKYIK
jgi:hypothetical protein